MKIFMKLIYQYMATNLHPLQVENCHSNSRLVVDEDDNGKFRLERVKRWSRLFLLLTASLAPPALLLLLLTASISPPALLLLDLMLNNLFVHSSIVVSVVNDPPGNSNTVAPVVTI